MKLYSAAPRGVLHRLSLIVVAALLVWNTWQLAGPYAVGTVEQGDGVRVTSLVGLVPRPFHAFHRFYKFSPAPISFHAVIRRAYSLPATLHALLATSAARLCGQPSFNISWLGLLYLLLIAGCAFFLQKSRCGWYAPLALPVVALSSDYLPILNTFLADPTAFVWFLAGIAFFLHPRPRMVHWTVACVSFCIVSFSKPQFMGTGLLFALVMALYRLRAGRFWPFAALCTALAILPPVWFHTAREPSWYRRIHKTQSLLQGLLWLSADPNSALRNLGLEHSAFGKYVGRYYWALAPQEQEELRRDFPKLDQISYLRMAFAYLRDREVLAKVIPLLSSNLAEKSFLYPNFAPDDPRYAAQRYFHRGPAAVASVRRAIVGSSPLRQMLFLLLCLMVAWRWRTERPAITGMVAMLVLFVVSQAAVVVVGEGTADMNRHLFLARFALDLLVFLAVIPFGLQLLSQVLHKYRQQDAATAAPSIRAL